MKVLNIFLITTSFLSISQAATIKQLLNDQNLALVELKDKETAELGQNFIVSGDSGQCLLDVLNIDKNMVTVSTAKCSDKSILSIGKNIEKSLFPSELLSKSSEPKNENENNPTSPPPVVPTNEPLAIGNVYYLSLNLDSMLAPKISITGTAYSGAASEAGTFEYSFSNALKLGFEWSQFNQNSYNSGFLFEYVSLNFDTATIKGSLSAPSTVNVTGGMKVTTIAYAGKYRWENFYLPFLVGISGSSVDNTALFTRTLESRSLFSLGVGININEKINLEMSSNAHSIYAGTVTTGGITIVPNVGFLNYLQFTVKFLFK